MNYFSSVYVQRLMSKALTGFTVIALLCPASKLTAAATGSIKGTLVTSSGDVVAGVKVFLAQAAPQPTWAKSVVVTGRVVSISQSSETDGSFSFTGLPDGSYNLCPHPLKPGQLNPCHWSTSVPLLTIAGGQALSGIKIVVPLGGQITVHVDDPRTLLPRVTSAIDHLNLRIGLDRPDGFQPAVMVSTNSGRDYALNIPFDVPVSLDISSPGLALADPKGLATAANGTTLSVTATKLVPKVSFNFAISGSK